MRQKPVLVIRKVREIPYIWFFSSNYRSQQWLGYKRRFRRYNWKRLVVEKGLNKFAKPPVVYRRKLNWRKHNFILGSQADDSYFDLLASQALATSLTVATCSCSCRPVASLSSPASRDNWRMTLAWKVRTVCSLNWLVHNWQRYFEVCFRRSVSKNG